jgi:hypothetical protein
MIPVDKYTERRNRIPLIPVDKYKVIKKRILTERGVLDFFGVILREDAPDTWDLVISAPWAESNQREALQYLSAVVKTELDPTEILQLSRVVILEKTSPVLRALLSAFSVTEDSILELGDSTVGGIPFRHAYILEAKRPMLTGSAGAKG